MTILEFLMQYIEPSLPRDQLFKATLMVCGIPEDTTMDELLLLQQLMRAVPK